MDTQNKVKGKENIRKHHYLRTDNPSDLHPPQKPPQTDKTPQNTLTFMIYKETNPLTNTSCTEEGKREHLRLTLTPLPSPPGPGPGRRSRGTGHTLTLTTLVTSLMQSIMCLVMSSVESTSYG